MNQRKASMALRKTSLMFSEGKIGATDREKLKNAIISGDRTFMVSNNCPRTPLCIA
jgi:hypothetical protein